MQHLVGRAKDRVLKVYPTSTNPPASALLQLLKEAYGNPQRILEILITESFCQGFMSSGCDPVVSSLRVALLLPILMVATAVLPVCDSRKRSGTATMWFPEVEKCFGWHDPRRE